MLSLVKRNVLGVVIGGAVLVMAAPSALAQKGAAPASPAASQPEPKEHAKAGTTAKVGEPAPAFTLTDTEGKTVKLEDYKGKIVVLDWFNPECPVCAMHYKAQPIQKVASKFKDKNVVFLAINSGGQGQAGNGKEKNATAKKDWKV